MRKWCFMLMSLGRRRVILHATVRLARAAFLPHQSSFSRLLPRRQYQPRVCKIRWTEVAPRGERPAATRPSILAFGYYIYHAPDSFISVLAAAWNPCQYWPPFVVLEASVPSLLARTKPELQMSRSAMTVWEEWWRSHYISLHFPVTIKLLSRRPETSSIL